MLDLLLNEMLFTGALVVMALLTPLAAWMAARKQPRWRGRVLIAWGAFGPVALLFWGWHRLVLATLGFDSVVSLLVVLLSGTALGIAAGIWIRKDPRNQSSHSQE